MAKKKPRFTQVNCRLFTEDVEELKQVAESSGDSWQARLRRLVHEAVKVRRIVR